MFDQVLKPSSILDENDSRGGSVSKITLIEKSRRPSHEQPAVLSPRSTTTKENPLSKVQVIKFDTGAETSKLPIKKLNSLSDSKSSTLKFPVKNIWKKISVNGVNPTMEKFRHDTEGKFAWTVVGIDLRDDRRCWDSITIPGFKDDFLNVHGILALTDIISNENIQTEFTKNLGCPAAKYVASLNALNEMRHNEGYGETIRTLIPDDKARNLFLHQILNSKEVQDMITWMSFLQNSFLEKEDEEDSSLRPLDPNAVITSSVGEMTVSLNKFENPAVEKNYDSSRRQEVEKLLEKYQGRFLQLVDSDEGKELLSTMEIITEEEIPPLKTVNSFLIQMFSEGMFFQFPFLVIFFAKSKGLMLQVCYLNDLINWDEGFHIKEGISLIFSTTVAYGINIKTNLKWKRKILSMALQSYNLCANYVKRFMTMKTPGFTEAKVYKHLKFLINLRLTSLGQAMFFFENDDFQTLPDDILNWDAAIPRTSTSEPINESPFDFMNMVGLKSRSNFFEVKVDNYAQDTGVTDTSRKRKDHYSSSELKFLFKDWNTLRSPLLQTKN